MTRRLYLAPIVTLSIGSRQPFASKVLEYGIRANVSSIMPNPVKAWCITSADFDDTQHALVASDPDILSIPFASLDNTWNDFSVSQRQAIGAKLEAARIPLDWIESSTTVADLIRMAVREAHLCQMLKADYPELDLDATFGTLSAAWRNRILNWANANNVDTTGLTASTTIRAMLRALVVRFPWNASHELPFMRGAIQGSIQAQILREMVERGEISITDLPFTAQTDVEDLFNRANSTNLGANWSEDAGAWSISSNTLVMTQYANKHAKCRWVGTGLAGADNYAECDVVTCDSADGQGQGPALRLTAGTGDTNVDGYGYLLYPDDNEAWLSRYDNGSETLLDAAPTVGFATTYADTRIEANGSALVASRGGGGTEASATDSTYASGSVGVLWGDFGSNTGSIDNWQAGDLATGHNLSTAISGATTTPTAVATTVERQLTSAPAAATATPNTAASSVERQLSSSISGTTVTPDTVASELSHPLSTSIAGAAATPDNATSTVERQLTSAPAGITATPDTATSTVIRQLSSAAAATTATPDTVTSAVAHLLSTAISAASATPDAVTTSVERQLVSAVSAATSTPDTVTSSVERQLVTSIVGTTVTPDDVISTLPGGHDLATAIVGATSTPDTVASTVERQLSTAIVGTTITPDTAASTVERQLSTSIAGATATPDDVVSTLPGSHDLSTAISAATATPDTVTADVERQLATALSAVSVTPDAVTSTLARQLASTIVTTTATPDGASTTVERQLASNIAGATATPDGVTSTVTGGAHTPPTLEPALMVNITTTAMEVVLYQPMAISPYPSMIVPVPERLMFFDIEIQSA